MKKSKQIRIPTVEEDAQIVAAALSDRDCPPLPSGKLAQMKPASVMPDQVKRMMNLTRGGMRELRSGNAVRIVAIREDIAERMTRNGGDLEQQVDEALRKAAGL